MKHYGLLLAHLLLSTLAYSQVDFRFRVTLIGTGVPPSSGTAASAILVEAGEEKIMYSGLKIEESV